MTAEQMPATDYEALRLQSLLDAAEARETAALASSNADLRGDPALTTG